MMGRSDLATLCSLLDAKCESGMTVEVIMAGFDIDPMAAAYVSEQRALRVALMLDGWTPGEIRALGNNGEAKRARVRLSPTAQALMTNLCATWLDGFATGLAAQPVNPPAAS